MQFRLFQDSPVFGLDISYPAEEYKFDPFSLEIRIFWVVLIFKNRASYIQAGRTATLQMLYFFLTIVSIFIFLFKMSFIS
jgi:hypothetical protein